MGNPDAQPSANTRLVEQRLRDSNRGFELGAIGVVHFLSAEDGQ